MAIKVDVKKRNPGRCKRKKTRQGSSHTTKVANKNSRKYIKPYRGQGRG